MQVVIVYKLLDIKFQFIELFADKHLSLSFRASGHTGVGIRSTIWEKTDCHTVLSNGSQ